MLCLNKELRSVDLSFNELPRSLTADVADDCVLPLCRALAVSTSLLTLRYAHAGISTSAGVQLGHALAFNCALTELDLSYNAIGDAGCSTIASALAVNSTLRALSLAANGIGHIGAGALCQLLRKHAAAAAAVGMAERSTRAAAPPVEHAGTAAGALMRARSPTAIQFGGDSERSDGSGVVMAAGVSGAGGSTTLVPLSVLCELNLEFNDFDAADLAELRDAWAASPWRLPSCLEA